MIENLIIFAIVGWAVWFTGRNLWREVKQGKCSNCYCGDKKNPVLVPIEISSPEKEK